MGHRNPDIGRRRNAGGDPGNHLNRHTALGQISGFFTTTAKQERITPFSRTTQRQRPANCCNNALVLGCGTEW